MKQDVRLAPAYFLPNYKYFDQLLQTVKNKTTVLNLVFSFQRVFTNISSTNDFCTLCKRVSRFSVGKFLSHSAKNFRLGKLCRGKPCVLCFRKFLVAKKFMDERGGGSIKIFRQNFFVSQCRKIS